MFVVRLIDEERNNGEDEEEDEEEEDEEEEDEEEDKEEDEEEEEEDEEEDEEEEEEDEEEDEEEEEDCFTYRQSRFALLSILPISPRGPRWSREDVLRRGSWEPRLSGRAWRTWRPLMEQGDTHKELYSERAAVGRLQTPDKQNDASL